MSTNETLPKGIKVRQTPECWVANIAFREYNLNDTEPKYTLIQSNGRTRDEAISNLRRMVWDELNNCLSTISQKKKEINTLENRRINLATWLDGGNVEVLE